MMPFDKCPACGGELIAKNVEKLLRGGVNSAVVLVSAEVCLSCGERYYAEDTVRYCEQIRAKLKCQDSADMQPLGTFFDVG